MICAHCSPVTYFTAPLCTFMMVFFSVCKCFFFISLTREKVRCDHLEAIKSIDYVITHLCGYRVNAQRKQLINEMKLKKWKIVVNLHIDTCASIFSSHRFSHRVTQTEVTLCLFS